MVVFGGMREESAKPRKNKRRRGEYKENSPKVHTAIKQNECDKARKEDCGECGWREWVTSHWWGVVGSEMNQLSPPHLQGASTAIRKMSGHRVFHTKRRACRKEWAPMIAGDAPQPSTSLPTPLSDGAPLTVLPSNTPTPPTTNPLLPHEPGRLLSAIRQN